VPTGKIHSYSVMYPDDKSGSNASAHVPRDEEEERGGRELQNIYQEEARSDAHSRHLSQEEVEPLPMPRSEPWSGVREGHPRSGREHPSVPREQRVRHVMEQRTRTAFTDRNRTYTLRDSEIYAMSEVGKFRVVAKRDLAEFAYNGDRERMENDIENLVRQGLAKETIIADIEYNPRHVVTLTKEGHKLLSRGKLVARSQAIYHGLKKPKEATHDADLYRLYHKVADEIEDQGGRVIRVQLDYEMKDELYSRLARASQDKTRNPRTLREEVANGYHLKVCLRHDSHPRSARRVMFGRTTTKSSAVIWSWPRIIIAPKGLSEKARVGFCLALAFRFMPIQGTPTGCAEFETNGS
jgi:hypothetical protein